MRRDGPDRRGPSTRPVKEPLFILGAPRSGTSLLYRTLALHPDAAWISNYGRRMPSMPQVACLNRVARHASPAASQGVVRGERRQRLPLRPAPFRAGAGLPAAGRGRAALRAARRRPGGRTPARPDGGHGACCATTWPGWPAPRTPRRSCRSGSVTTAGSRCSTRSSRTCRFVVMSRDGRAVARSLVAVDWWPDTDLWWYGGTPRDWARRGGDPLELAARHWVMEVEAIESGPGHRGARARAPADLRGPGPGAVRPAPGGRRRSPGSATTRAGAPSSPRCASRTRTGPRRGDADGRVDLIQGETLRALGYPA